MARVKLGLNPSQKIIEKNDLKSWAKLTRKK